MPALEVSIRHAYSPLSVGIEVPISLFSGAVLREQVALVLRPLLSPKPRVRLTRDYAWDREHRCLAGSRQV